MHCYPRRHHSNPLVPGSTTEKVAPLALAEAEEEAVDNCVWGSDFLEEVVLVVLLAGVVVAAAAAAVAGCAGARPHVPMRCPTSFSPFDFA